MKNITAKTWRWTGQFRVIVTFNEATPRDEMIEIAKSFKSEDAVGRGQLVESPIVDGYITKLKENQICYQWRTYGKAENE
jgi:hypothetical protein